MVDCSKTAFIKYSGFLDRHRVDWWKSKDVSEELSASIFRAESFENIGINAQY